MAENTLTKAEWQALKVRFDNHILERQAFMIDGYKIVIENKVIGRKLEIMGWVNGEFCGKWFVGNWETPCEELKRFFPRFDKPIYSDKWKRDIKKIFGKETKERFPDFDNTRTVWKMTFKSIDEVRRTFEANNKNIELCHE